MIKQGQVWKFKDGHGSKYRRLRILYVQKEDGKVGPYVEVRAFYLDQPSFPGEECFYQKDPRKETQTLVILQSTLLRHYECISNEREERGNELPIGRGFQDVEGESPRTVRRRRQEPVGV